MRLIKLTLAALLSLALSACFHIQLSGSVGGGTLTITPLRAPGMVLASATSTGPSELIAMWGNEGWEKKSALVQLLFVGVTTLKPTGLDPDALYLVTATGGQDYDPDGQLGLSNNPEPVQGSWHAIVSGARIIEGKLIVSALTEALYQQVREHINAWTDARITERLDAAAQLVVGDLDESGTVDFDDVLRWNRTLDAASYQGDIAALDALAGAVTAGQPADMLTELAQDVLGKHTVIMDIDAGIITLETLNWDAPITAANFLAYVRAGFYDQTLVHRAIDGFMFQAGLLAYLGLDGDNLIQWEIKTAGAPIANESSNGLSNLRGTLAMARTSNPNSATSQFFINQDDNTFLDYGSGSNPDGYAVFARVVNGIGVVDEIVAERTVSIGGIGNDVPARGVIIQSVSIAP